MKKKIILIILVISIFFGLVIGNELYKEANYFADNLICFYDSEYNNYTEELRWKFVENILYDFERVEKYTDSKENPIEKIKDTYDKEVEKLADDNSEIFKYKTKFNDQERTLTISTYILALKSNELYNNFFKDKELVFTDSIEDIKEKLKDTHYCIVEKE